MYEERKGSKKKQEEKRVLKDSNNIRATRQKEI